ncbi:MAG TPA: hypothetical protein VJH65_02880 [Candidatus Nanoarchaeia archaeon]|nr:hypothetical protein [Candidatus Nanoarchaeia archaeon]
MADNKNNESNKRNKKILIIALIVAIVLVLAVIAGIIIYKQLSEKKEAGAVGDGEAEGGEIPSTEEEIDSWPEELIFPASEAEIEAAGQ